MSSQDNKQSKTSIEQKIQQLDQAIEWFYSDNFNLDEAITKYQATQDLAQEINQDLEKVKNQVQVIADYTKDNR